MNRLTRTAGAAAMIGLLSLAGCDQIDPLKRPYMWYATGVNDQNIAAMAVNPADLVHGRETALRRVSPESDGVDRFWSNKPTPLLGGTAGSGASGASAGGASGGGASSGGGT